MRSERIATTILPSRVGFTLVELLVVLSIISTLAGLLTVAYRGAQQEAFEQKTRTTVKKIGTLLAVAIQEYSNEPFAFEVYGYLDPTIRRTFSEFELSAVQDTLRSRMVKGDLVEQINLLATRDILRLQLPDHPDDIKWVAGFAISTGALASDGPDVYVRRHLERVRTPLVPGLNSKPGNPEDDPSGDLVLRVSIPTRAVRLLRKLSTEVSGKLVPLPGWHLANANSELLYLIVEDFTYDGSSALELFGASEIADSDGDGLKEFVDAWGRPIEWVRWPSGFSGVITSHPDPLDPSLVRVSGGVSRLAIGDEPYDLSGKDPGRGTNAESGPLGVPLVISAGQDGLFGIRRELDPIPQNAQRFNPAITTRSTADCVWFYGPNPNISQDHKFPMPDPWYPRAPASPSQRLGAVLEPLQASDNITNLDGDAT